MRLARAAHRRARLLGVAPRCRRSEELPRRLGVRVATRPPGPGAGGLTPGEPEVLHLLADGLSNRAVARRPAISQSTVIRQVANLFAKLRAHTRAEAVREGCARGLITISR